MRCARGFTVVEVLVAIMLLDIGVLALIHSYTGTSRMIAGGRRATLGAAAAQARIEQLRQAITAAPPGCASVADGSAAPSAGLTETWHVAPAVRTADITVIVSYSALGRFVSDTFVTTVACA